MRSRRRAFKTRPPISRSLLTRVSLSTAKLHRCLRLQHKDPCHSTLKSDICFLHPRLSQCSNSFPKLGLVLCLFRVVCPTQLLSIGTVSCEYKPSRRISCHAEIHAASFS